jgi:cytochrome c553
VARLKEAQANPKLAEALLKSGQKNAMFCANCHGDSGNSTKPEIPNLAGQNATYLVNQLNLFASGQRRNEFMEGMIKALKPDEKVGLVMFYSGQGLVTKKSGIDASLVAKGKDLYGKNCFRCHAADGHGNEVFARIAGQQTTYLKLTLQRYRYGPGVRTNPLMESSTKLLTDADIDALVAYVASME